VYIIRNSIKIVGMIGIDDEISLSARRPQAITLRRLAREARLTLRHFESGADHRPVFWVDVINPAEPDVSEGFSIPEDVYRELRAMGVPEVDE
jgi:hypothetical protein